MLLDPIRGVLYYPGQPVTCRKCGTIGHTKSTCNSNKCRLCRSQDHVAAKCDVPKKRSLCGGGNHLYRDCGLRKRTFADLFSVEGPTGEEKLSSKVEPSKSEGALTIDSPADPASGCGAEIQDQDKGHNMEREEEPSVHEMPGNIKEKDVEESEGLLQAIGEIPEGNLLAKINPSVDEVQVMDTANMEAQADWASSLPGDAEMVPEWAIVTGKRPLPKEDVEEESQRRTRCQVSNRFELLQELDDMDDSEPCVLAALSPVPPFPGWEEDRLKKTMGMGRGKRMSGVSPL